MQNLKEKVKELIEYPSEEEWFEFKENWFEPAAIGEYISSMSNSAALTGEEYAYLIWGVNNDIHEITGTTFDFHQDVKNEPLQHYLARQVEPDIGFDFKEITVNRKRVVVLIIPAARKTPTSFREKRYIRIGSSKADLHKYPERESKLFDVLRNGLPSVISEEAEDQELTFRKLFLYYEDKGITLNKKTFRKNLKFLTKDGKYNMLAQLLSDNSRIAIRVSIFRGEDKASPLYSVREFGNNCLLLSLDKVLEYGDVLNVLQADEKDRVVERKEVPLFDHNAFREAVINAFVHNKWIDQNAPMISAFSDRIEILSRGTLPHGQTLEGFFDGESVPVNKALSDVFLQLHISERSGRGVPAITKVYGREAFQFRENSIRVTIPFAYLSPDVGNKVRNKEDEKRLNPTRQKILEEMRNNPGVTQQQLELTAEVGKTAIYNNIRFLRENGYIKRIGSKKNGYWQVEG